MSARIRERMSFGPRIGRGFNYSKRGVGTFPLGHRPRFYGPRENPIIILGMKISEMGEFGLVEMIADVLGTGEPGGGSEALLDIGDDTAAWRTGLGVELATTDTMVQDVHFRLETTSCRELGWKALALIRG